MSIDNGANFDVRHGMHDSYHIIYGGELPRPGR